MSNKRVKRSSEIPIEVLEDILVRLPLQSLFRFKSVHKSWRSLVASLAQNPNFVSKQLHHRPSHSRYAFEHAIVLLSGEKGSKTNIFFLKSPDHDLANWDKIDSSSQFMSNQDSPRIVGHCNGLICFSSTQRYNNLKFGSVLAFSLWNPFFRQHKILPVSNLLPREGRCTRPELDYLGFGHDHRHNDYKVVRIAFYDKYFPEKRRVVEAEVYSMLGGSWRPVTSVPSVLDFLPEGWEWWPSVNVGGFSYWVGFATTPTYYCRTCDIKIISFDFAEETIRVLSAKMPFMNSSKLSDNAIVKLVAWKESVAVVSFPRHIFGTKWINVWVLSDIDHSNLDPDYTVSVDKYFTIKLNEIPSFETYLYAMLFWNDELILNSYHTLTI